MSVGVGLSAETLLKHFVNRLGFPNESGVIAGVKTPTSQKNH